MTSEDEARAKKLFEILLGRSGKKEQLQALLKQAESFADFRVLLIDKYEGSGLLTEIAQSWRRRVATLTSETDDRELMHDLEILSLKQTQVEKLLRASEASLVDNLRAVDNSATQLATLGKEVREIRAAISECRSRVSEMATRKIIAVQEKTNGHTRASN